MKVLFLDFDGVLNHVGTPVDPRFGVTGLQRDKGLLIRKILDETGAVVVVSSMWRLYHDLTELRSLLTEIGIDPATVIDKTTDDEYIEGPGKLLVPHPRGQQIRDWLTAHPDVDVYAIVDDTDDMDATPPVRERFVQTDWGTGILDEQVEQLIQLLGRVPKVS